MLTMSASTTISGATITDISIDEINNWAVLADTSNSGRILAYSLSTGVLALTAATLNSSPQSVLIVNNSASAVVAYSSSSSVSKIEIPSGYKTDHTGGTTLASTAYGKKGAYNPVTGVCLWGTSTSPGSRVLLKFNTTTGTTSTININIGSNAYVRTITYIGNSRYIVGTSEGELLEIDDTAVVYGAARLEMPVYDTGTFQNSIAEPEIINISKDNNLLCITTLQGTMHIWDWSTKVELTQCQIGGSFDLNFISNAASGVVLFARNTNQSTSNSFNPIHELDMSINPHNFPVRSTAYVDNTTGFTAGIQINTVNGRFATYQQTGTPKVIFGVVTPRDSVVQSLSSPGNVTVELLVLDDTTTDSSVVLNTYMTSPGSYRLPTGKNLLEILKNGDGVSAQWSVRTNAT